MSPAARQRHGIEEVIRAWFAAMTPEDREREGSKLAGFLAARLAFWVNREAVATLLYELGDQVVITTRPGGDPT
jgi:hypothetical protein